MSEAEIKDAAWWERYFAVGGDWERFGGREQTRIFAEHFVRLSGIDPGSSFSLLDVGCALGDALQVFAAAYPSARLHGIDLSHVAIARARDALGNRAALAQGDIDTVDAFRDVIYCSNTLEHFPDFDRKARALLAHCQHLFIMVPFHEMRDGRKLEPDPTAHHQHTFDRGSFDFLVTEGLAARVKTQVFAAPGAWGWSLPQHAANLARNLARAATGRRWVSAPRQILFAIDAVAR